jgi:DNA (cytosine-5)-methyltransferase 1
VQQSLFADEVELWSSAGESEDNPESYRFAGDQIIRTVTARNGGGIDSTVSCPTELRTTDPAESFDQSWLRSQRSHASSATRGRIRVADFFSGAGGMSVGLDEAARALALEIEHVFAADIEREALATYQRNFSPLLFESEPVQFLVDGQLGATLTPAEIALRNRLGELDLVVGGPPCQGHSDLNNHTRREDPKNALYERMARVAEVLEPQHLIIENVPGVRHDRTKVFDRTLKALSRLGYNVDAHKLEAERLGVPQRRHRAVIVASRAPWVGDGFLRDVMKRYARPERSVQWAVEDLLDVQSDHPIDRVTSVSDESQRRIDWLFENGEYDLPDSLRPECHRTKKHTYKSVYGRLYWDQPAWTITTGFQVMGQGRFLHPLRRRVITSREAARLQFFPDFFDFGRTNRKGYAKMIGNAVPAKLAYVLGLELLR